MSNFYRDIFITKGDDFIDVIEISVPFDEYNFSGDVRSSVSSSIAIPITCEEVPGDNFKMRLYMPAELTSMLVRRRGVYSITATNKLTFERITEREGTAHYSQSSAFVPSTPPPPNYVINVGNIADAGSAARADIESFATALQGELANSAIQPEAIINATNVEDLTNIEFLLKGAPIGAISINILKSFLQNEFRTFILVDNLNQLDNLPLCVSTTLVFVKQNESFYTIENGFTGTDATQITMRMIHRHSFDDINSIGYFGKAPFGSTENDLNWNVTRIILSNDGSDIITTAVNIPWTDRSNNTYYT